MSRTRNVALAILLLATAIEAQNFTDCSKTPELCGPVETPSMNVTIVPAPPTVILPPEILPVGDQSSFDIPPLSIQQTGVRSISQFLAIPGINECKHPVDNVPLSEHWLAAGYFVDEVIKVFDVLTAQRDYALDMLDKCQNPPAPPPPIRPQCDRTETFFDGMSRGNLWKPVSEARGNPVVLVGSQHLDSTNCGLHGPNAEFVFCTFRNTNGANGGRAHFDLPLTCENLWPDSTFRIVKNGISTCWNVPDTCERLD